MILGYATSGLAHHDLLDAVRLSAEIGYRSVAITIDHRALPPGAAFLEDQLTRLKALLAECEMRSVIEVDPLYLLDARRKGEPSLVSASEEGRGRRVDLTCHAIDVAARLESDCVSIDSGRLRDDVDHEVAMERLSRSMQAVLEYASLHNVVVGFEPEPGMFVDTVARFERLLHWCEHPRLKLTLDVGHLYCQGEVPIADYIRRHADRIVNVHLADMRAGVHRHLLFGEGEMDFFPILKELRQSGYQAGLHVQLGRLAAEGPVVAARAFDYLDSLLQRIESQLAEERSG